MKTIPMKNLELSHTTFLDPEELSCFGMFEKAYKKTSCMFGIATVYSETELTVVYKEKFSGLLLEVPRDKITIKFIDNTQLKDLVSARMVDYKEIYEDSYEVW